MTDLILLFKQIFYEPIYLGLSQFPFFNSPVLNGNITFAHIITATLTLFIMFIVFYFPIKIIVKIIRKLIKI